MLAEVLIGLTKNDAVLGGQAKYCEPYVLYGERYFVQSDNEMRVLGKF